MTAIRRKDGKCKEKRIKLYRLHHIQSVPPRPPSIMEPCWSAEETRALIHACHKYQITYPYTFPPENVDEWIAIVNSIVVIMPAGETVECTRTPIECIDKIARLHLMWVCIM